MRADLVVWSWSRWGGAQLLGALLRALQLLVRLLVSALVEVLHG